MDDHWCFRVRSLAHLDFRAQLDRLLSSWMWTPTNGFPDFPVLANLATDKAGGLFGSTQISRQ